MIKAGTSTGYNDKVKKEMVKLANTISNSITTSKVYERISKTEYDLNKKQYNLDYARYLLEKKAFTSANKLVSAMSKFSKNNTPKTYNTWDGKSQNVWDVIKEAKNKNGKTKSHTDEKLDQIANRMKQAVESLASLSILRRVPSALGAVLDLLEFGILFLLKPIADLLALFLMPIAKWIIQLALWVNGLPPILKNIVAFLEGILIGLGLWFKSLEGTFSERITTMIEAIKNFLSKVGEFVGKGIEDAKPIIAKLVEFLEGAKAKFLEAAGKILDPVIEAFSKLKKYILDDLGDFAKPFLEDLAKLREYISKGVMNILESIAKGFEDFFKSDKGVFNLDFLSKPLDALKKVVSDIAEIIGTRLYKVLEGVLDIFEKWGIKEALAKILVWFGEGGLVGILGKCFAGLVSILDLGFYSLIAEVIAWLMGWIASYIDANNPLKYLVQLLGDVALFIADVLDIVGLIWAACEGIYNALVNGDWSFSALVGKIANIGRDVINAFIDIINGLLTIARQLGVDVPANIDRITQDFAEVDKNVVGSANATSATKGFWENLTSGIGSSIGGILGSFSNMLNTSTSLDQKMTEHYKRWGDQNGTGDGSPNESDGYSSGNQDPYHKITPMAAGGIVTSPVRAIVGEAGAEAVIPLDRLKSYIGNDNSTSSQPINIQFSGIVDEIKFRQMIQEEVGKVMNTYQRISGAMW